MRASPARGHPVRARLAAAIAGLSVAAALAAPSPAQPLPAFTINPTMAKGPAAAPVTIVEFSDYQCPYCRRAEQVLGHVLVEFAGKVRLVYKDFPLSFHSRALPAALAARCAAEGGRFWEYHDLLFAGPAAPARGDLVTYAVRLDLPRDVFVACLDSGRSADAVKADVDEGRAAGVTGTPTFFINGRRLVGAQPFEAFRDVVQQAITQR
jgi:protein-disulfide isomerase